MPDPDDILRRADHVVVIDWPRRDIPDSLARAGLRVTVYGGPSESDVVEHLRDGDDVVTRAVGRYPAQADVVAVFRPFAESEAILRDARRLGAATIWREPDTGGDPDADRWRTRVEAEGFVYVDDPPIDDVARRLRERH